MMRLFSFVIAAFGLIVLSSCLSPATSGVSESNEAPVACENLTTVDITNGTITLAESVATGAFVPPTQEGGRTPSPEAIAQQYGGLPPFCRVAATLTPSDDSDIKVEVWMPASGWNRKYQAVGNGAFTGSIRYRNMALALAQGYATSSTDTGHLGNTASFGLGHPEKIVDFGWRSVHEMAVTARHIIAAHYANPLRFSYFVGCSAGGRQAMKEAQRFPEDFDGIIAGAPGLDWTGRAAGSLRVATYLEANEAARLSADDRQLVHLAGLSACDANDGVEDGVIGDPERCTFDPAVLQCDDRKTASCLTASQVDTVRMLYESPVNPASGRAITGLFPGSELGWTDLGWTQSARTTGLEQYRYLVYQDLEWSVDQFDFDTDIAKAEETDADTLNALDPNLAPFFDRGGKLIQYHGWSDPQISPGNATQYYQRVVDAVGDTAGVHESYRLFMAPGMGHCGGGAGPNSFDMLPELEAWVEKGEAPNAVVAEHRTDGVVDQTRPLCPYPQQAVYQGNGSTDDAENFVCKLSQ